MTDEYMDNSEGEKRYLETQLHALQAIAMGNRVAIKSGVNIDRMIGQISHTDGFSLLSDGLVASQRNRCLEVVVEALTKRNVDKKTLANIGESLRFVSSLRPRSYIEDENKRTISLSEETEDGFAKALSAAQKRFDKLKERVGSDPEIEKIYDTLIGTREEGSPKIATVEELMKVLWEDGNPALEGTALKEYQEKMEKVLLTKHPGHALSILEMAQMLGVKEKPNHDLAAFLVAQLPPKRRAEWPEEAARDESKRWAQRVRERIQGSEIERE